MQPILQPVDSCPTRCDVRWKENVQESTKSGQIEVWLLVSSNLPVWVRFSLLLSTPITLNFVTYSMSLSLPSLRLTSFKCLVSLVPGRLFVLQGLSVNAAELHPYHEVAPGSLLKGCNQRFESSKLEYGGVSVGSHESTQIKSYSLSPRCLKLPQFFLVEFTCYIYMC